MAKIKHIAIFSENPAELAKFYVDVFGMKITGESQGDVWVTDGYMDVALISRKSENAPQPGIHHWGFTLDEDEKPAVYEKMTALGLAPSDPRIEDRLVSEVAKERGVHPVDLALDISLENDLKTRFRMAVQNYDEDEVAELLKDPNTVIGLSDAGAHASQLCDACFSTYLLARWVREKHELTLEQAVYMLTGRPAKLFGLNDRGQLAVGLPADVTVFDPNTVGPSPLQRVHDLPNNADRLIAEANGIHAVIVNGTLLRMDNKDQIDPKGALPGKLLRGQPDSAAASA